MEKDSVIVIFYHHKEGTKVDLEIPLNITASELIVGLNQAFHLGIDTSDLANCFLRTENPIAFLKGNKTLADYQLIDGTIINYLA